VRVVFLGTGGYHPSDERHTACIMLPEQGLVLDAGTGAFRIPANLATRELDIFLSHAHLDHVVGLTYLLAPMVRGELSAVRVHATGRVIDALKAHLFSEALFPVMPAFDFQPLAGDSLKVNGLVVRWQPLPSHPGTSMAYRVDSSECGSALCYVTDTMVDGSYDEFIRGADLLIHECYFADEHAGWAAKTGHSTVSRVLETAEKAGVGRLVLVHVDPSSRGIDPLGLGVRVGGKVRVELARDGIEMECGGSV
jgi:ribonuclease Z